MRRGFTFVEVIVLILLATFLLAAFGPRLNRCVPLRCSQWQHANAIARFQRPALPHTTMWTQANSPTLPGSVCLGVFFATNAGHSANRN